ncbi:DUF4423 domain-containing protein [Bacteriovoracaceae bacterium]|nr:DUF4423 domain-containing protein [Bacteriovoracaceae bacterium]
MIYESIQYKSILRDRIKEVRSLNKSITMKVLADRLGIQPTYLSKFFNQEKIHLGDDNLFSIAQYLDFSSTEIDYLQLLKAHDQAELGERKEHLFKRIKSAQNENKLSAQEAEVQTDKINAEMEYLLDPICLFVHLGMDIDNFRNYPFKLCEKLGISRNRLIQVLKTLEKAKLVELDENFEVVKIVQSHLHYGKLHPLMRTHQAILKTKINSRLLETSEGEKQSLLVTFTSDKEAFEKIQTLFTAFLKEVEEIVGKSRNKDVYQLNFDLFKWF